MFRLGFLRLLLCLVLNGFSISFASQQDPLLIESNQVTFDFLTSSTWTSHVIFFDKIFKKIQPGTFLEFGLGNSTKFFLENSVNVVSIELNAECSIDQTLTWYHACKKKFAHYQNWTPIIHQCSKQMSDLTKQAWRDVKINIPPQSFIDEVSSICNFALTVCHHDCTIAFVDSALFGRGYIVSELLKRHVPIVAAHNTDIGMNFYAWDKINTPDEYILVNFKALNTNQLSVWFLKGILSEEDLFDLQDDN